jgi:DDE superfamily endonuclease
MLLGIGIMTACKCIHECTRAICLHMYTARIRLPTPAEARVNIEKWMRQTGLAGIYGAIDGTHLAIRKPCHDGRDYFNRKLHYSINMQSSNPLSPTPKSHHSIRLMLIEALVDYKKRFLDLEIGSPGSVGDCRIFENSYLNSKYEEELTKLGTTALATEYDVEENIPAFILGDSAYRNSRHMVTTYKVTECNADSSVRHLNFELSKTRYQVEHAFGLLKGRFQIFEKPLRSAGEDLPFSVKLVASICVIHNFLIDERDTVTEEEVLWAAAERNGGVQREDNDDEDGGAGEASDERVTREAFVRHSRWLDEENEA